MAVFKQDLKTNKHPRTALLRKKTLKIKLAFIERQIGEEPKIKSFLASAWLWQQWVTELVYTLKSECLLTCFFFKLSNL